MNLSGTVKSIQDIMRQDAGVDGDAQRIGELAWLLFLKIYDAREQVSELIDPDYQSVIPEDLRWRNWASDPEGITGDELQSFVNDRLFPELKSLELGLIPDPRIQLIRSVFEDAYHYMKNGTLLRQVINTLEKIDFTKSGDVHIFGDMYEKLLKDLQSAGNAGEFYTPRAVTQFMAQMLDPKPHEKILDPACGTGGFLSASIDHMQKHYVKSVDERSQLQSAIHGIEKKQLPHILCVANMLLHGIEVPSQIIHDNTLSRPLTDIGDRDRVDVVLTNPPFGGTEEPGIENNFPASVRTRETADLFLVYILRILKPGGRAAIVLPDGTLFGEGVKSRIKEKLLTECDLHTIVRLPKGVFSPYASIATNLLFFRKGLPTKDIWYYQHHYPEGYKSYSKTKPIRLEEFESLRSWWDSREENEQAWRVPVQQIKENNWNLDIKNPNTPEEENGDPDILLAKYTKATEAVEQAIEQIKNELFKSMIGRNNDA